MQCPKCNGRIVQSYDELQCINCGYYQLIILTQRERERSLIELGTMTDKEFSRDYGKQSK